MEYHAAPPLLIHEKTFASGKRRLLNYPNFGSPINYLSSLQFGQATPMMNNYLGSGGDNPMYQIGVRVRSN